MHSIHTNLFFDAKHPLIIAHRGFALECHENTLEAFAKALNVGADMIEFDVRQTKDGCLIIFHDEVIAGKLISSIDYIELRKIGFSEGIKIPTLEETLAFIGRKAFLIIEIKEVGYEIEALSLILKHIETNKFLVISFHDEAIKRIKEMDYSIATGLLLGKENPKNKMTTRLSEIFPLHRLKKCNADFIIPHYKIAKLWRHIRFINPKKKMIVWTVNEKKEMQKLLKNGVAGIITDCPDLALQIRNDWKSKLV